MSARSTRIILLLLLLLLLILLLLMLLIVEEIRKSVYAGSGEESGRLPRDERVRPFSIPDHQIAGGMIVRTQFVVIGRAKDLEKCGTRQRRDCVSLLIDIVKDDAGWNREEDFRQLVIRRSRRGRVNRRRNAGRRRFHVDVHLW